MASIQWKCWSWHKVEWVISAPQNMLDGSYDGSGGRLCGVWQRGFSELRVEDRESYLRHRDYIAQNPVKAGWVDSPEKFPYCFTYLAKQKLAGAKAH
jgi:hypothetical protein